MAADYPPPRRVYTVRTADGVEVAVSEWGRLDGPEILFIHGVAQAHLCFFRQFASGLADRFRLVAYDLRGHGESGKPRDAQSYREGTRWGEEVAAVIAAAGLRRPVVVAWSLGGRVLREYLARHGDAGLSGLVVVSSRAIEDPAISGPGSRTIVAARPNTLAERIETNIAFLRDCFEKQPSERDFEIALAYNMLMPAYVREALNGWAVDPDTCRRVFEAVTVPALVCHGDADRLVLPAAANLLGAAMPQARLSFYEGCGHSPFAEQPERFNRELAAFASETWRP